MRLVNADTTASLSITSELTGTVCHLMGRKILATANIWQRTTDSKLITFCPDCETLMGKLCRASFRISSSKHTLIKDEKVDE